MRILIQFCAILVVLSTGYCAKTRQRNRQNGSNFVDRARRCSPPKLMNGFVTPLFRGKMMRFDCNKGYSRLGERYSECANGRWSLYSFPICIKSGCPALNTLDNGKITYMNGKATAMLFCEPNFEIVGSNFAHCNGTNWDRAIGTCKETDNLPPTSCDFEIETICGWVHDTDNDLDFERRSGYNNKTISILTGPSVDHTIGVPFQGHFMVINTNTEVFLKKARLISPLYRINASKICFQFFYHMYGISVGTLKVYVKPESVDIQDIIMEDMETEAKNDYVIFEIKGTQGNSWHRGSGMVKNFNESFQIIIEAISGQTRLSDIAIDDVSILTDEDCDDDTVDDNTNETDARENDIKEDSDDNADGIFSIDSCVNRCFEDSNNSTVHLNANKTLSCSCSRDCNPKATCCPDFLDVCIKDDSSFGETTPEAMVNYVSKQASNTTTTTTTTVPTTTSTKSTSTSTTTTSTIKPATLALTSTSLLPKTTKLMPIVTTATTTTQKKLPSTTLKVSTIPLNQQSTNDTTEISHKGTSHKETDVEEVFENPSEIEDEFDIIPDEDNLPPPATSVEKIKNEKFMMHTTKNNKNLSFIISTIVIAVSSALFAFIAIFIVYKQYRKSTNPLNYKEKSENGTRRADEEFSEIRYLTSDEEALDFALATPDSVTDL